MSERTPTRALAIVAIVALGYATWLGAHWLPLSYSSGEIPLYASRVWDIEGELGRSGHVAWWSGTFMNGGSTALPYACFPLVPWAILARAFGLVAAGKLVALLSIAASGVTMFLCARHFLRSGLAASLSAFAYLFHPLLLVRAAGTEHISVVVFAALLPLGWLSFARVLDRGRFRDIFACAVTMTILLATQNKQTAIQLPFLAAFAAWSLARAPERRLAMARATSTVAGLTIFLAAFVVVPVASEAKLVRIFEGEPLGQWQRFYSLHGLGPLVRRTAGEGNYIGLVLLFLLAATALLARRRADRSLLLLLVAFEAAGVALAHGPESIASAAARSLFGPDEPATAWSATGFACALVAVVAGILALATRSLRARPRARLIALAALAALLLVPWFRVLELVPLYRDIRAPDVFCEVPCAFFGALLVGFFVTDVLEPRAGGSPSRAAGVIALLAALLVVDAWPFQAPTMNSDIPISTIDHARAMYARLGEEAKREGGKVYIAMGMRPLYLMGPSWGGPPIVNEGTLGYMAPRGTGLLQSASNASLELNRDYIDLVGARWIVFDKGDPLKSAKRFAKLAAYRAAYPVDLEDEDFVVFRVPTARPYVSGYPRAAVAPGDLPRLPEIALALAGRGYVLLDAAGDGGAVDEAHLPSPAPRDEAIGDLGVTRDSAERIAARFTANTPCTAVVDESYYPYWRATLDGRPVEILRAAYGLMGVRVTEGTHEIVLRYEVPRAYAWSAILSAVTFVVAAAKALLDSRARRPAG